MMTLVWTTNSKLMKSGSKGSKTELLEGARISEAVPNDSALSPEIPAKESPAVVTTKYWQGRRGGSY